MARYEAGRRILTSDEVDLERLLEYGTDLTDEFNANSDRMFQSLLGQQVDTRTFRRRVGEIEWAQSGELEKARTGRLDSESMAFTIDEYKGGLGWTRNFVEDNPSEILMQDLEALVDGADELMFEKTFEVMDNGIADGTELEWTRPPSPGANDFGKDHDHVYADSAELFGDENVHTRRQHVGKAAVDLTHHKYSPDIGFVSPDFAFNMVMEDSDNFDYQIREARDLLTTPVDQIEPTVNGIRLFQTAELTGDDFYIFDSSKKPIYYNWVRPVEIAQEDGAPVVDPSDLLSAIGSARFGLEMVNPFAGVKGSATNTEY